MKQIAGILLVVFILICGCSSAPVDTVVEPTPTIEVPTPITVTPTWIQTVGPTPTPTNDIAECYNRSIVIYPEYCYDVLYWVRPTYSPRGMGYTAKVWKNDGCINLNKTSGLCEGWGDNTYTVIFMKNQTIVRNLSGVNATEVVASMTYYNKSFDLNAVNGDLSFSEFIEEYWDGTYPGEKYNKTLFEPDLSVTIVPVDTFNPDGF